MTLTEDDLKRIETACSSEVQELVDEIRESRGAMQGLVEEALRLRLIVEHVRSSPAGCLMISQMGVEPRYECSRCGRVTVGGDLCKCYDEFRPKGCPIEAHDWDCDCGGTGGDR